MAHAEMTTEFVKNAAGRRVPTIVNGRTQTAYEGATAHRPSGDICGVETLTSRRRSSTVRVRS